MYHGAVRELPILYRDRHYVAVYKPAGLLVHRTRIADGDRFAMQWLRDQLGCWVYPVHRLDRPACGVLLFGLSSDAANRMMRLFEQRLVEKTYLAVVRGHTPDHQRIDYPLQEEPGKPRQPAVTDYRRLAQAELPYPVGRYPSARYSLLQVRPLSGRLHQIRKHMKHIFHPIVGDTTHGDGAHNRFFRRQFGCRRLLLMARGLAFRHPFSGAPLSITGQPDTEMLALFEQLGWDAACRPGCVAGSGECSQGADHI